MLGAPRTSGEKYRILVIASDAELSRLLLTTLAAGSFECRLAPDGANGLAAFRETEPHLVLLDLAVIGGTTTEVCINVRESSMIPLITLSNENTEAEHLEALRLGADAYLAKPINPKLLMAQVVSFLRRVYRYDMQMYDDQQHKRRDQLEAQRKAMQGPVVPPGWALCNTCNYMGPRTRFERFNPEGAMVMICPNCTHREDITYAIG